MFNPNFVTRLFTTALLLMPIAGVGPQAAQAQNYNVYGNGYSYSQIGGSGFGYTDNGGSFSTNSIGNSTFYNGTDGYGNSYSGSCTTIGNTTFCN